MFIAGLLVLSQVHPNDKNRPPPQDHLTYSNQRNGTASTYCAPVNLFPVLLLYYTCNLNEKQLYIVEYYSILSIKHLKININQRVPLLLLLFNLYTVKFYAEIGTVEMPNITSHKS